MDSGEGNEPSRPAAGLGVTTGTLLIVANMIGVGVFATTGYMVSAIPSSPAILLAWLCGGIAALCGALTYAELGAVYPRNGGEYRFLSDVYHPAIGFAAGWVSLIVGFSAPLAMYSMAFGEYLQAVWPAVNPKVAGLCVIAGFAVLHSSHVASGSRFHNSLTMVKIALISLFVLAGLTRGDLSLIGDSTGKSLGSVVASAPFAVQLVYVSFAYGGWNTAAYLAGEFRRPQHDVPRAVLAGTLFVTILYLGLNVVFLASAPLQTLAAELKREEKLGPGSDATVRIGHVAATFLFGASGGKFVSLLIAAGLVSTVSANLMSGPRVYEAMGEDHPRLNLFRRTRAGGGPAIAIGLQAAVASVMLVTSSFDQLMNYVGITLSLFAMATVSSAITLRWRAPELSRPYRTWGYPVTPVIFLALEGWMIAYTVIQRPVAAAYGAGTIAIGVVIYAVVRGRRTSAFSG